MFFIRNIFFYHFWTTTIFEDYKEILENHEKSWNIMKNHEIMMFWSETLLPNSFQQGRRKPIKRKIWFKNITNWVNIVFIAPQNILQWMWYAMGVFIIFFQFKSMA